MDGPQSIDERRSHLSPAKQALLEKWKDRGVKDIPEVQSIPRRPEHSPVALSFVQQRLWFLHHYMPRERAPYNLSQAIRLKGPFQRAAFERALHMIVQRHEILRTGFLQRDGEPEQVVAPTLAVTLPIKDLRGLGVGEREKEIAHLLDVNATTSFDLATPPLMRVLVVWCAEEEHLLQITMHHMISDGWSLHVLAQELSTLYNAYVKGETPVLAPLPIQYADFASWQRQQGEQWERLLSYWRTQLAGISELALPYDYPRPASEDMRGASQEIRLSQELTARLRRRCQEKGVTLFILLLAAFQVLLQRYSRQDDIVLGIPIANRARPETEGLIGCFLDTLALRGNLEGDPTFDEHLYRVRDTLLAGYAHQELPFEKLVEVLQPQRDPHQSPIFNVMVNFAPPAPFTFDLCGLAIEPLESGEPEAKYALTLYAKEQGTALQLELVYQRALFAREHIKNMLEQFEHLLEQIAADGTRQLSVYSLVTPAARPLLPDPHKAIPEPFYDPLPVLIAACAQRFPTQPAVAQGTQVWSYQELNERARTLASLLQQQGMRKGEVIAVTGARSFGLIVALLGLLRNGGILLLLERALPEQRKKQMLQLAGARRAICIERGDEECWLESEIEPAARLDIRAQTGLPEGALLQEQEKPVLVAADDPAYIFFTSGTTGTPKGVVGLHKGLSHFLVWQRATFGIGTSDRAAQLTALSFDVILRDIFLPLISGATLCIPDEELVIADPRRLLAWLEHERITVLHTVPSLASFWLTGKEWGSRLALRLAFFAGEPLSATLVERWRERIDGDIINLYGPTETTLAKCWYRIPDVARPGIQPVGSALPETQALVMRGGHQLCGIGEPGEIVIRTPFRSAGYLNASEEHGRFVRNPYRDDEQDLLYHTGDLGAYCPDGTLAILGRLDQQVKIRGVRIELEEIKRTLLQHPGIQDAVVVVQEGGEGEKHLAAYLVAARESRPDNINVRDTLHRLLPQAMVPTHLLWLESIPLTPNGKVDYRALPLPPEETLQRNERPATVLEELLASIWSQLLGKSAVGVEENFFELGGHSLLAMRLIAHIRDALHRDLPLRAIFEAPTIRSLAREVERTRALPVPPLTAAARNEPFPLSFGQQRLWFLAQLEPASTAYLMVTAWRLRGPLSIERIEASIQALVQRHEILRTSFPLVGREPRQQVAPLVYVPVRVIDLAAYEQREEEMQKLYREEQLRPFDLAREPLFRILLVRMAEQEHVLLVSMHHMISDGWSMMILLRDLGKLYQGKEQELPGLTVQYADYALWQRNWLQGEMLQRHLTYWQECLRSAPAVLNLPTDHPRPSVQSECGAMVRFTLSAPLTRQLQLLCRQEGTTLFMLLLAAFQMLLWRLSGMDDILVGTPVAGRGQRGTEPLIGIFINMLVLRSRLVGKSSFRAFLRQVRETCLDAYMHQDLPFERLVEALQPERSVSYHPLFQVMFALQNMPEQPLAIPDLSIELLPAQTSTTKFDLALTLQEDGDELLGNLDYRTDLFKVETMQRWIAHYQTLLEAIVTRPERPLFAFSLLSAAEERQLLLDWDQTGRSRQGSQLFVRCFERQAARLPEKIALIHEGQRICYADLNRRANQLARYLQKAGVGPEVLVGIYMDCSPAMVLAHLAVMKAGGACLPLDPTSPREHLAFLIEDAQVVLLVTQEHLLALLPATGRTCLCLERNAARIDQEAGENLSEGASATHLACVFYTSGSTGRPEGVQVTQGALTNFLYAMCEEPGLGEEDTLLATAPPALDIAALELYLPLMVGARVVMAPHNGDLLQLQSQVSEHHVTFMQATPTTWRLLLEAGWQGQPGVKLLYRGERLSPSLATGLLERGGSLWKLTGSTETTVCSAVARIPAGGTQPVTIGWPVAGTSIYLLDRYLQPVPIGVWGEIYIGGDGVARGYVRRPEQTSARFLPDPFRQVPGARMYRTGDFGRYRGEGGIEFLGGGDLQVNVRGFHIQLGEIEGVLQRHPAIAEVVVLVREENSLGVRIIAYAVFTPGQALTVDELREYARQHLPDYMLPDLLIALEYLPLTPGGKIDRRALPAPQQSSRRSEAISARQTAIEQKIAAVWREVLQVENVGLTENFFDLGGHSLLLVQVYHRLRETLQEEITLPALFRYPSIRALARHIEQPESGTSQKVQNRVEQQRTALQRQRQQMKERRTKHDR